MLDLSQCQYSDQNNKFECAPSYYFFIIHYPISGNITIITSVKLSVLRDAVSVMVLSSVTSTLMASRLRLVGPTSEKQRWLWFEGMKALREENKLTVDDVECL